MSWVVRFPILQAVRLTQYYKLGYRTYIGLIVGIRESKPAFSVLTSWLRCLICLLNSLSWGINFAVQLPLDFVCSAKYRFGSCWPTIKKWNQLSVVFNEPYGHNRTHSLSFRMAKWLFLIYSNHNFTNFHLDIKLIIYMTERHNVWI